MPEDYFHKLNYKKYPNLTTYLTGVRNYYVLSVHKQVSPSPP